ncbi:MAG TPA: hypothetical protein VGQ41_17840 [Pyrinomonadaceae bacterium]|jgi:hypothetical protein|nr:hypothetical protein [Pyrinomonadaceae bacterium]
MATSLAYLTYEPEPQLQLLSDAVPADPQTQSQKEVQANLNSEIDSVIGSITNPELREISQTILKEMLRFFDWLARIENNLQKLDTLLESLSLLEVLEFEARSLTDYIETRAISLAKGNERLREVLDGITYGINHDLRRIFERELVRGVTEQSIPIVYGKILHAHGLLTNCFQQSTITLLQVFKPSVDGAKLFNDVELRLQQSLTLCKDLSSLMRFVRLAQANSDPDVLRSVTARILEFRDGSMHYLMYKDWRGYESLALEVITAVENNLDLKDLLHRFICYLELLYGHVKMRAVLADEFPYSGKEEES